jgi:hypothetical protein
MSARGLSLFACGVVIGGAAGFLWPPRTSTAQPTTTATAPAAPDVAAQAQVDLAYLKEVRPSQSHTMIDVGYHASNMWFAVQKRNWALARFYFNETRQHILWTVRVRPVRQDSEGKPVDLKAIFEAIDTSSLAALKETIEKKDHAAFAAAYRRTLEACYSCHKASSLPFLRPMIPLSPLDPIINADPDAKWPE